MEHFRFPKHDDLFMGLEDTAVYSSLNLLLNGKKKIPSYQYVSSF